MKVAYYMDWYNSTVNFNCGEKAKKTLSKNRIGENLFMELLLSLM